MLVRYRQPLTFGLIGGAGFVVDAAVFFTLTSAVAVHYAIARILASLIAMTLTWWLNRTLTFAADPSSNRVLELGRYLFASGLGALANLLAMSVILSVAPRVGTIIAYVAGTAAGMVTNYTLYKRFVFARQSSSPSP